MNVPFALLYDKDPLPVGLAVMIEAVKELKEKNAALEARIAALEG